MVTTLIDPPKKVAKGFRAKDLARQNAWWLQWSLGDRDKATDLIDVAFYDGQAAAYENVRWFLETAPWKDVSRLPKDKLFKRVPAAIAVATIIGFVAQSHDGKDTA